MYVTGVMLYVMVYVIYFEQIQGVAMASSISPTVANLYMEEFETRTIYTAEHPPRVQKGYVDDTLVVTKKHHTKKSS